MTYTLTEEEYQKLKALAVLTPEEVKKRREQLIQAAEKFMNTAGAVIRGGLDRRVPIEEFIKDCGFTITDVTDFIDRQKRPRLQTPD